MKKNKIGFTLIEMMTVVAIIILLTTALTFSVSTYMGKAQSVSNAASSHMNNYESAKIQVNALNLASPATPTPTSTYKVQFENPHFFSPPDDQYIAMGDLVKEPASFYSPGYLDCTHFSPVPCTALIGGNIMVMDGILAVTLCQEI